MNTAQIAVKQFLQAEGVPETIAVQSISDIPPHTSPEFKSLDYYLDAAAKNAHTKRNLRIQELNDEINRLYKRIWEIEDELEQLGEDKNAIH